MNKTLALQGTPEPFETDAAYEAEMGITAAVEAGTMKAVAGVDGASFTAIGVAGLTRGEVTFTFVRAFMGDYEYAAAGQTVRGVHVAISVALDDCGEHTDVRLIQVLRYFRVDSNRNVVTAEPPTYMLERAGWNVAAAHSKGWMVDGLASDRSPFYVSGLRYGNHGSSTRPARLRDSPGSWATDRNMGKEFRTCAVSYAGGKGTVLACVDWGYRIDGFGEVSFYPSEPTAYAGAVIELTSAAARWDALPGHYRFQANLL